MAVLSLSAANSQTPPISCAQVFSASLCADRCFKKWVKMINLAGENSGTGGSIISCCLPPILLGVPMALLVILITASASNLTVADNGK